MPPEAPRVIAIDGPAGSGKSTVARALAKELGFAYLDTGAMYRAVTLEALRLGIPPTDTEPLARLAEKIEVRTSTDGRVWVGDSEVTEAIRSREVDRAVSEYSAVAEVRRILVDKQRRYAEGGAVVEGRDIGTAVFPDAPVRVFLTAEAAERARRRHAVDRDRTLEELLEDIEMRDRLDSTRQVSPLARAEGAVVIDTTGLTPEEVVERILALWRQRGAGGTAQVVRG